MEELLMEFVASLEESFKSLQKDPGNIQGIPRLTISQFQYIDVIFHNPGASISEIALQMDYSKASITTGINKLVKLGLVIKTPSTTDRRISHVMLSPFGDRLVKTKYKAIQAYSERILSILDNEELKQFEDALQKILSAQEPINNITSKGTGA